MKSHLFCSLLRICALLATVSITTALAGCASSATKASVALVNESSVMYGRVTKVVQLDMEDIAKECKKADNDSPAAAKICSHTADYELARLTYMHVHSHDIRGVVVVPKADRVAERYILQVTPSAGLGRYVRIAAKEDSNTCKWLGPTPEFSNGSAGVAVGFLAGLLIVPGVVAISTDAMSAGVECDGWSYKTIVERAKKS